MRETMCKKLNEGRTCPCFQKSKYKHHDMVCTYDPFIDNNKCYMEIDKKVIKQYIKNSKVYKSFTQNWDETYYAMSQVFSNDEIDHMTDKEINYLLRLGYAMSEEFY